jgi:hypothetical protein
MNSISVRKTDKEQMTVYIYHRRSPHCRGHIGWPETAKFLTYADRALLLRRLRSDAGFARMEHLDKRAAKRFFSDWKICQHYDVHGRRQYGLRWALRQKRVESEAYWYS